MFLRWEENTLEKKKFIQIYSHKNKKAVESSEVVIYFTSPSRIGL